MTSRDEVTMKIICPRCKRENKEGETFCVQCGFSLTAIQTAPSSPSCSTEVCENEKESQQTSPLYPEVLYSNPDTFEAALCADKQYLLFLSKKFAGKGINKTPLIDLEFIEKDVNSRTHLLTQRCRDVDISIHLLLDNCKSVDEAEVSQTAHAVTQAENYQYALFQRREVFYFLHSDITQAINLLRHPQSSEDEKGMPFLSSKTLKKLADNLTVTVSELLDDNYGYEQIFEIVNSVAHAETDSISAHKEIDHLRAARNDVWFTNLTM